MNICSIKLKEFSAFKSVAIDFSPGLNVFIGANATGKSHLMKLMYSMLKVMEPKPKRPSHIDKSLRLKEKLSAVFMPDNGEIGRLVRRRRGRKKAEIQLGLGDWASHVELTTLGRLDFEWLGPPVPKRSIFIPSRESLSMYDGFIAAYEDQKLSIDETYYDLCVALSGRPLRGKKAGAITKLLQPLQDLLGGTVVLDGGRFHVHAKDGLIEAHLLAEGFRKIASIAHLIGNGSLIRNGFLFWDEPEANLNPRLITRIADALRTLARGGVQVLIATHDYLLSHELSLAVEYDSKPRVATRFFAFTRTDEGPVDVDSGDTLADLRHNPILDEFAAHYDRERDLYSKREGKA